MNIFKKGATSKHLLSGIVIAGLFASNAASAALINNFAYTVNNQWNTAATTFTAGDGVNDGLLVDNSLTEISWGAVGGDFTNPGPSSIDNRSALVITDPTPAGNYTVGTGITANSGELTHYNNTIAGTYRTLTGGELVSTLTLTAGANFVLETDFTFNFIETPNAENPGDCSFDSISACDDIFILNAEDFTDTFVYDGYIYTVSVAAAGIGPLNAGQCAAAGVAAGCSGFLTQEGQINPAQLMFGITAEEIPEPASIAFLALGVLGLVASARKK